MTEDHATSPVVHMYPEPFKFQSHLYSITNKYLNTQVQAKFDMEKTRDLLALQGDVYVIFHHMGIIECYLATQKLEPVPNHGRV